MEMEEEENNILQDKFKGNDVISEEIKKFADDFWQFNIRKW